MFFEPINAVTWKPMHFQLLDHYIQFRPPPIAQDPSFIPKYAVPPMSKLLDQTIRFRTFPRSKVLYQNMQSLQSQRFWTKTYRFAPPPGAHISYQNIHLLRSPSRQKYTFSSLPGSQVLYQNMQLLRPGISTKIQVLRHPSPMTHTFGPKYTWDGTWSGTSVLPALGLKIWT